jgi:hypothetical protein
VIIWISGGFGAGKTTLAQELHRRLPDAAVHYPEDVGAVAAQAHAETLIVPMSLIRGACRAEILGGLAGAGEEVLHVFLETDPGVLRDRLTPAELADQVLARAGASPR